MIAFLIALFSINFYIKKRYYYFLILVFFLFTAGFQIIPNSFLLMGLPINKLSDYGMFAIFTTLFIYPEKLTKDKINMSIVLFFGFLIFSLLYSIFYKNYSIGNILGVFRIYIIFIVLFVFNRIPVNHLLKALNFLMILTSFQCILYLLQVVFRVPILLENDGTTDVQINSVSGYLRFYNSPPFMLFSFIYFLFVKNNNKYNKIAMIISALAIFATLHRTFLLMTILSIFIYLMAFTKTKKWIGYSLFSIILILMLIPFFQSNNILSDRFNNAIESIDAVDYNSISNFQIGSGGNSLLFRIAHFSERFVYIVQDPIKIIFGVGLITDNEPIIKNLPFKVGTINTLTGTNFKINTGDVLWSLLILQLGVFGTFLYFNIFIRILKQFLNFIYTNKISILGAIALIQSFLTTISSTSMRRYELILILLLLVPISKYNKINL